MPAFIDWSAGLVSFRSKPITFAPWSRSNRQVSAPIPDDATVTIWLLYTCMTHSGVPLFRGPYLVGRALNLGESKLSDTASGFKPIVWCLKSCRRHFREIPHRNPRSSESRSAQRMDR